MRRFFPSGETLSHPFCVIFVILPICPQMISRYYISQTFNNSKHRYNYEANQTKYTSLQGQAHQHGATSFPSPHLFKPYLLHPPCRALTSGWDPDNMLGAWDTPTTSSSSHLLSPEYFECTLLCFQKFSNLNNKLYGLPNLRGIKHFTETKLVNKGPDHYFPGPLYKHLTWISASTLSCCSLTNITKHLLYIWIILETVYIRIKQTRLLLSSSLYSIFRNILKTKTWPWHFPALNLL